MLGSTARAFGFNVPLSMYFFLIGLKYSAISFKSSRSNPVSYFEPCKVLTSDSVGGCEVPPPKGEIAVSTISTPASIAFNVLIPANPAVACVCNSSGTFKMLFNSPTSS